MRRNGKNWRQNITYEWCDNPPRRNTKANNRWLRELRKQLVALPLAILTEWIGDGCDSTITMVYDAHCYQVKIPRSQRALVKETGDMVAQENAGTIGATCSVDRPAWKLAKDYLQRKRDSREWRKKSKVWQSANGTRRTAGRRRKSQGASTKSWLAPESEQRIFICVKPVPA